MARGLWGKIESIREQPEHIRMRYVIGCLFVSMIFIVGIWLLSLGESFQSIGEEVPAAAERGKEMLPKDNLPSLGDLMQSETSLRIDNQKPPTNDDYFNEQFQKSTGTEGSTGN